MKTLEAALAGLSPASRIDRDGLMFRAGQQSPRRGRWRWPAATCLMGLATVALAVALIAIALSGDSVRIVYVPGPAEGPANPESAAGVDAQHWQHLRRYFDLQRTVAARGLDGLPPAPPVRPPEQEIGPRSSETAPGLSPRPAKSGERS